MKNKLNVKNAKFINCFKSKVSLANIAEKAAEMRKFDNAISSDVESVGNSFRFCENLG